MVGSERDEQHPQRSCPLRLRHAMQMKRFGGSAGRFFQLARAARFVIEAPRHRLQQLPGILKVAAPQQCGAFTGQVIRGIGGQRIVDDLNTLGR